MAFLEPIFGAGKSDAPDHVGDDLKTPDPNEATDLGLHVRQCARRYGVLADGLNRTIKDQAAMQRGIGRTQLLLIVIIVLLLLNKSLVLSDLLKFM